MARDLDQAAHWLIGRVPRDHVMTVRRRDDAHKVFECVSVEPGESNFGHNSRQMPTYLGRFPNNKSVVLRPYKNYVNINLIDGDKYIGRLGVIRGYGGKIRNIFDFFFDIMQSFRSPLEEKVASLDPKNQEAVERYVDELLRKQAPKQQPIQSDSALTAPRRPVPEYPDRTAEDIKLTVVDYIAKHWGDLLDGTFTRSDLRQLAPRTEMALRNYERQAGKTPLSQLNLPTVQELNDRLIESGHIDELRARRARLSRDEERQLRKLEVLRSRRRAQPQRVPA